MGYLQHIGHFFLVLLLTLLLIPIQTEGADAEEQTIEPDITKGKWRCEFREQTGCSWSKSSSKECVEIDGNNKEDYEVMPAEWYELDFDTEPIKLYFCSKSGCATEYADPDGLSFKVLEGVEGYDGIFKPQNWKAVFMVEYVVAFGLSTDIYIFQQTRLWRQDPSVTALDIVRYTTLIHMIGQCKEIEKLSKPGNPFEWIDEQDMVSQELEKKQDELQ